MQYLNITDSEEEYEMNNVFPRSGSTVNFRLPPHSELLSYGGHLAVGVVLTFTSIFGITINGGIIYTFVKNSKLWTPTNYFILGLVVSDFLMAFLGTPMVAISSFFTHWVFGQAGCKFYAFLMSFLGYMTIVILTVISIARFIITVCTTWKQFVTRTMVVVCLSCAIVYSFLWAIFPFLGWNSYGLEAADTSCSVNWRDKDFKNVSYSITIMFLHLFFPFGIMVFCYGRIFQKIRKDSLQGRWRLTRRNWSRRMEMDRKITMTIILMIAAFVVSWFPYSIVCMWSVIGNSRQIPVQVAIVPTILAKISVLWNPLIYIARSSTLRNAMKITLPCLRFFSRATHVSTDIVQHEIEPDIYLRTTSDRHHTSQQCNIEETDCKHFLTQTNFGVPAYYRNVSLRQEIASASADNNSMDNENQSDKFCQTEAVISSSISGSSEYYSVTSGIETTVKTEESSTF